MAVALFEDHSMEEYFFGITRSSQLHRGRSGKSMSAFANSVPDGADRTTDMKFSACHKPKAGTAYAEGDQTLFPEV